MFLDIILKIIISNKILAWVKMCSFVDRNTPKNVQKYLKKCYEMVKKQNFKKMLKCFLDIYLKIIFL